MVLGMRPECVTDGTLPWPSRYPVITREYALYVAIKNGGTGIHRQGKDRAGGRASDAG